MRIVPPHPVFHHGSSLKRLAALGAIVAIGGCAKFPPGGATAGFTRVIVRLEFAGNINPAYIYDIAITATNDINPQPQLAPLPVLNENNPNGRMAGSPTHFVEYSQTNPGTEPFVLYRFATQTEVPNPNDPDNPTNLQVWGPSTRRRIINFDNPSAESNVLQFEIFTDQLAATDTAAPLLNTLLINFLPMNRLANASAGNRIIDALGDTRSAQLNEFLQVDLRANRVYQDTSDFEPEGDTLPQNIGVDPALDLVNYRIEVQTP